MKVLFLPDYTEANAYQRELAAALRMRGVAVAADPTGRRRILPVLGAIRRHGRPNIIHLHWTEPYIAGGQTEVNRVKAMRTLTELRLLKAAGVRVVWTAHDLSRHDRAVDPAELAFNRSLVRLCDAVIVHCEAAGKALLAALDLNGGVSARMHVIPHGHYVGAYPDTIGRDEARQRLGVPADARVFSFVGWVRPYKGVTELLDAFGRLDAPGARLVIAGKPGDLAFAAEVEAAAAADARVVTRLGFVPDDELQLYLNAADVVALPYREIFTSGSVLLAMSFGRAVIVPRRGCIGETVDESGALLYDADDPVGLSGALSRAMTADLEAMGTHNTARLPEFSWSRIASLTVDVYRGL
ncbi:MAG: glycosyltransferase [Candidatus Limnocylindrales bacterium]